MKLTINTETLMYLLNKVNKCASNNKLLPLTCMTCFRTDGVCLHITTTNGSDYAEVTTPMLDSKDFYVVVDNDIFYKLVAKTTTKEITLELINQTLIFTGNGRYTLELPIDENGELVKFPTPKRAETLVAEIRQQELELINKINRANLSTNMSEPCYTNFYLGNQVITSDRSVICTTDINVTDIPVLINPTVLNILDTDVLLYKDDNIITFVGNMYVVYTKCAEGIEDFDADAINTLVETPLDFKFSISKSELLTTLDRLELFVSIFDKNCLVANITRDKLILNNIKSNSSESINIKASHEYNFNIDIEMFKKIISAMPAETFELQYGSDLFIKLITDNVVEIVPLMVE